MIKLLSMEKKVEQEKIFFDSILDIVDKQDWNNIDLNAYIEQVIKLAEMYYNLPRLEYETSYLENDTLGSFGDNKIEISEKLVNFRAIYNLTNTIFHELRHAQQFSNNKLKIDGNYKTTMPVVYCTDNINMLDGRKLNMDPYDIYFTSYNEKDARDTSLKYCQKLFKYLDENVKSEHSKHYTKIILSLIKKDYEIEKKYYAESMYKLIYNERELNSKTKNWLIEELEQLKYHNPIEIDGIMNFHYWFFFRGLLQLSQCIVMMKSSKCLTNFLYQN